MQNNRMPIEEEYEPEHRTASKTFESWVILSQYLKKMSPILMA